MLDPSEFDPAIRQIHERLLTANEVVFFTGAGASAESGIPTFRDGNNGFWKHFRPEEVATPEGFAQRPRHVQDWYAERWRFVRNAQPNLAHQTIAELERECAGTRFSVLTQNVDGLHQAAGSRRVLELHGSIHRLRCHAGCGHVADWSAADEVHAACPCCQAPRRPDLVWFGEALPQQTLQQAFAAAAECDLLLSIGTSGQVYPAAQVPQIALRNGAQVVHINPQAVETGSSREHGLQGAAGVLLPQLVRAAFAG